MRNAILAAVIATAGFSSAALAEGLTVGVSWSNFQEERWKTDEAAIKAALEAGGNTYVSADAQASAAKQLTAAYAPLGAVMVPEDVYQSYVDHSATLGTFAHGLG